MLGAPAIMLGAPSNTPQERGEGYVVLHGQLSSGSVGPTWLGHGSGWAFLSTLL